MPDLLVRLYDLPALEPQPATEPIVRRAFAAEKRLLSAWIATHFSDGWAGEAESAFARQPLSAFLAVRDNQILGFACYDATARGFFGPTGVAAEHRGNGLGRALLLHTLYDMRAAGYAYAIIGAAGQPDFYRKAVNAIEIPESTPGFYRGLIRPR